MLKHEKWLGYAEDELKLAKLANSSPHYLIVGAMFNAQQCIEKSLKAYCVYKRIIYPKTHDLIVLIDECKAIDDSFLILKNRLTAVLTLGATKNRYLEDSYPTLFLGNADESIAYAEKVYQFVLYKTGSSLRPLRARIDEKSF